jgi:hypothetical protein
MIRTVTKQEALDCPLVAMTSFPEHFEGYIRFALEDMNIDIAHLDFGRTGFRSKACPTDINGHYVDGTFYTKYTGTLLFFHAYDCDCVMRNYPNRKFRTLLLDHRVQPFGDRAISPYNADTIICNGSDALIRDIRTSAPFGNEVRNVGFFTTHYASPARKPKTAFVQAVGNTKYQCQFDIPKVSQMLLDEGYEVNFFDHVLHRSVHTFCGFLLNDTPPHVHYVTSEKPLPKWVRIVKPGVDYIRTLTSCSHYVGYGSSSILTNSFMPGATQILLQSDWLPKCPALFRSAIETLAYPAATLSELRRCLTASPKDDSEVRNYLFGKDRTDVLEKVEEAVIQSLEYRSTFSGVTL